MRQKGRRVAATKQPAAGDPAGIDLGASARQVGLFETANGLPHGPAAIVVAVVAALLLVPARAIWRALTARGSGS